jgi:hypothetical protein
MTLVTLGNALWLLCLLMVAYGVFTGMGLNVLNSGACNASIRYGYFWLLKWSIIPMFLLKWWLSGAAVFVWPPYQAIGLVIGSAINIGVLYLIGICIGLGLYVALLSLAMIFRRRPN